MSNKMKKYKFNVWLPMMSENKLFIEIDEDELMDFNGVDAEEKALNYIKEFISVNQIDVCLDGELFNEDELMDFNKDEE